MKRSKNSTTELSAAIDQASGAAVIPNRINLAPGPAMDRQLAPAPSKANKPRKTSGPEASAANKHAKWTQGLAMDLAKRLDLAQEAARNTSINPAVGADYKQRFEQHVQELSQLRTRFETTKTEDGDALAKDAPAIINRFKDEMKAWKKVLAIYNK